MLRCNKINSGSESEMNGVPSLEERPYVFGGDDRYFCICPQKGSDQRLWG
jgi:hypothetical protein